MELEDEKNIQTSTHTIPIPSDWKLPDGDITESEELRNPANAVLQRTFKRLNAFIIE